MSDSLDPPGDELEVARRLKAMRDDDLMDFIRDTVVRLNALADRLEAFTDEEQDGA